MPSLGANPGTNQGFTLAEDAALKYRLGSLAVSDDKSAERVCKVFFRYPEGETEKLYPFITIELIGIDHARDRQESERTYTYSADPLYASNITYYPSEMTEAELEVEANGGILVTEQLVPINLMYQITTYTRAQRHDRQLTSLMLRRVFPFRRGFIEIPEDGTIRRCDIVSWRPTDVLDKETGYKNHIFRKVYTVVINSEIPQSDLYGGSKVLAVSGEITEDGAPVSTWQEAVPELTYPYDNRFLPTNIYEGP